MKDSFESAVLRLLVALALVFYLIGLWDCVRS